MIRLALALLMLSGCTTSSLVFEGEHISHPLAGWPVGPCNQEDSLTQVSVLVRQRTAYTYFDIGLGYNVSGTNGGGFYGPALTAVIRGGIEWRVSE